MTQRTKDLLQKVDEKHDWACGQVWGGPGDEHHSTDVCRICGLKRAWRSGSRQNNTPSSTSFTTAKGEEITLREAAALEC